MAIDNDKSFHVLFIAPYKGQPEDLPRHGSWSLHEVSNIDLARATVLDDEGNVRWTLPWPGFIGLYGSLEELTEEMRVRSAIKPERKKEQDR